ncbi:MAG: hypothetical protein K2P74_04825 [Nitrosomonas sp.]|nr:hypothetical protein [Nitrosomonas sp.]
MKFEVVGEIANVETIAQGGNGIRDLYFIEKTVRTGQLAKKERYCAGKIAGRQYGDGRSSLVQGTRYR